MKPLNIITLLLIIIGGINWGLVGLFNIDLVATIFGPGSTISRIVYVLVGASAVYQLIPFAQALSVGEVDAQADIDRTRSTSTTGTTGTTTRYDR